VHYALQDIYEKIIGKNLTAKDLTFSDEVIAEAVNFAIEKLNHEVSFYERGMNFIHKSIAERVVRSVVNYDLQTVLAGNSLEILSVEGKLENINFNLKEDGTDQISFYGYIDRIDRLNGTLRIIDFKTAKTKNLTINQPKKPEEQEKLEQLFFNDDRKQAMQLSIYAYSVLKEKKYPDNFVQCGIWSFAEVNEGVQNLQIFGENEITLELLESPMNSVKNVILQILNPEIDFVEKEKASW